MVESIDSVYSLVETPLSHNREPLHTNTRAKIYLAVLINLKVIYLKLPHSFYCIKL